ncbi:hypothetical protein L1987_47570 [Smallanthus sonchifolius]|uniref:Uncharacterized protein n=1 Tax=Smallanthus sonchifolius TaxID=185202 RepID=A0ACB9G3Y1_9ASTR|nr:hypothetical protein L1987_47570 [Smallanthus sonchifolius]
MSEIMPSLSHDNRNPRVLIHNALVFRGISYSYHKLPKSRLKLSVLKLDGSSFGVEVPMSATVAELKLALEEFFNLLPKDERCTISWSRIHEDGESGDASNCDPVKLPETSIFECQCEEEESGFLPGSKLTNFLRGWFSYRKLRNGMI